MTPHIYTYGPVPYIHVDYYTLRVITDKLFLIIEKDNN